MKKVLLSSVAILILFTTSCGGDDSEYVEITIHMSDYAFEPSQVVFPAGVEIRLTLLNDGTVPHELLIGRELNEKGYDDDIWGHKPSSVESSGTEGFHVGSIQEIAREGFHVELEPGASGTLIFTLPKGQVGVWEMGCFIVDPDGLFHYTSGMSGKAVVTAPLGD